ncbi:hypothetical protein BQ6471_00578 [Vibrio gazogenes]|nr:hypothetical protein BQ6471_00578 [Vibrio gazogenes]
MFMPVTMLIKQFFNQGLALNTVPLFKLTRGSGAFFFSQ